jgi:hypothetical protein
MKACPLTSAHHESAAEENGPQGMYAFETSTVGGAAPDDQEEDNNEAEENFPQAMDASETILNAGDAPYGPEEDKKMKTCPLASAYVENEAEENCP